MDSCASSISTTSELASLNKTRLAIKSPIESTYIVGAQKTKRKKNPQTATLQFRRNKVVDSKGTCLFAHKMYQSFCHGKKKEGEARKEEEVGPARLMIMMMMFIKTKEL
jgi:hypothetical protein